MHEVSKDFLQPLYMVLDPTLLAKSVIYVSDGSRSERVWKQSIVGEGYWSEQVTASRMVGIVETRPTVMRLVLYLEDGDKRLSGQLVLDDEEEFAEGLQEEWGPHALAQQVLDGGQDVELCLLSG